MEIYCVNDREKTKIYWKNVKKTGVHVTASLLGIVLVMGRSTF